MKRSTARRGVFTAPKGDGPKVTVRTPNKPGSAQRVDKAKYEAMRAVLLKVLPRKAPGLTQTEMMAAVMRAAPRATFPDSTSMWWAKCVQLDLEAKGVLAREVGKPLRWHRA